MQEELLDAPDVSPQLLIQNLNELDLLNRTTGGHAISLEGIKLLMKNKISKYHIMDLGCGSGDWLRYMAKWAYSNGVQLQLTGVDKNPDAIELLKMKSRTFPEINGYTGDYRDFIHQLPVDIFHSALFFHHLSDAEIVELLEQMNLTAGMGFVMNDLRRTPLAYYAAKIATRVLGGSSLSKHDGPVSVLRGFTKEELNKLLKISGIEDYAIHRRRFFRFLVVGQSAGSKTTSTN